MKQYSYATVVLAVLVVLGSASACQSERLNPVTEPTPDIDALVQAAVEQAVPKATSMPTPDIQATVAVKVEATVTAQARVAAQATAVANAKAKIDAAADYTPTPTVDYVDTRGTYWAEFTKSPTICNGVITLAGQLENGATFAGSSWYTFGLGDTYWNDSIAFLPPLESGIDYTEIYEGEQVALTHIAEPDNPEFELVSAVPLRFENSDRVNIAIWGYVPSGYEGHNLPGGHTTLLREATVSQC